MSPAANDMDAIHRENERAFGDYVFSYTPPDGEAIAGLRGDFRDSSAEAEGGGESETLARVSDLRLGVRVRQLADGVAFEMDGMILGLLSGNSYRIIDVEHTDDHAWLYLFSI